MTNAELFSHVDHTCLRPEAVWADIERLCDEALRCAAASVCIHPGWVGRAAAYLAGRVPVCTVIGFPLGATSTAAKAAETRAALADGCDEFDMVIDIGRLRMGDTDFTEREIRAVCEAAQGRTVKVIIETCLLTDAEKIAACEAVCRAGAAFVKTSTGFSTGGATFEDVALLVRTAAGRCRVKAAGGIRTREDMERFLALGAARLGTSSAVRILGG